MKIAVIGAAGQLGHESTRVFAARGHQVVSLTRREVDVTDHAAVQHVVAAVSADVIVNCTAFNDVDGAEDRPSEALAVNAFAVRSLARACAEAGATLVHYSTDFVFDGIADHPYRESDRANPQSLYAQSKLLGEWFAADAPRHYVLRVESLFGGAAARSSVDRIVDALATGQPARVFTDRTVSPSYVEDVAEATESLLAHDAAPGLYHCVNTGATTWAGIGEEAARLVGADPGLLEGVSIDSVRMRAQRPRYCALSNEKLREAGIEMPAWQAAVARYLARRRAVARRDGA